MRPRILAVDDEPAVVEGIRASLRRSFDVAGAGGGEEALRVLEAEGPFEVIISDMRMPGMDGATLLARVRTLAPDTTRMLLTGYTDLAPAVAAINLGQIFRFLTKPCPTEELTRAIDAGIRQYRLVTSERVLLAETLRGSVQMLTDLLAIASPVVFGRAQRIKGHASALAVALALPDAWSVEVAAMLSQVGAIALPADVAERHARGAEVSAAERAMVERVPEVATRLLANIPRLEPVREILEAVSVRWDARGEAIPIGARVLRIVLDHDALEVRGEDPAVALVALRARRGLYDPRVLDAWHAHVSALVRREVREVPLRDVHVGMVFVEDVRTRSGVLIVARGQEATPGMLERLRNFAFGVGVAEPLRVRTVLG